MTIPLSEPLLTVPYVGLAEFKASPTWLDLQDLVEGGSQTAQDDELYNQLLKASSWADNFCTQTLHAHVEFESVRSRIDRRGRMFLHPVNNPVRSVVGVAYGTDFQNLAPLANLAQTWVEDARGIIVSAVPWQGTFSGTLQFGSAPSAGREVYVQYSYVAGYANTYLTSAATAGQTSLTVADPTGFNPAATSIFNTSVGGSTARIWDPGNEEAVAVAPSYVTGANPVTLTSGLVNNHAIGVQVTEFPADIRQAVTQYACGLLLREDTADDMPFPGSPGPTARRSGSRGVAGGLIDEAERLLMPYRRVR